MEDADKIANADEFVEAPAPVKPDAPAPAKEAATTDEASVQAGVEKRIAKIVWQREELARKHEEAMRRIAFLEGQAAGGVKPPDGGKKVDDDGAPKQDQYESYDDYMTAVVEYRVERALVGERARRYEEDKEKDLDRKVQDRLKVAREKHADWDIKVRNPDLDITPDMGRVIVNASQGADIAYWLASNPAEATRISRLDPDDQVVEVGKIASKLDITVTPLPEPSKAPAPIVPVRGSGAKVGRDPTKESDSQWWYAEQKEDAAKRRRT